MAVAALRIAAEHMDALPRSDLAAFAVHCMRAGLPEQAAEAARRAPEELAGLVAALQGLPDKVPSALAAAGELNTQLGPIHCPRCWLNLQLPRAAR